ncbi:MAG TPA: arginase family protein [Solirubrobacterales bacterium]|jgi:arginase
MEPLTFIGVPIDSVGRDGGTEHSPAALRELGLPDALGGGDRGDLPVRIRGEERDPETGLLGSADVLAATEAIRAAVAESIAAGERPFLAGGCCAELPGALAGARDALGQLGLAHLDGHLDLYDGVTSPTGEAADMPISVALGLGPAAWVEAAGGASTAAPRTALVGFRDQEEARREGMRQPQELEPPPLLASGADLRARGHAGSAAAIVATLAEQGPFWLHFDVDVLDPACFPATDYLMSGGMDWDELQATLHPLLSSPQLVGASLGCYNPDKDPRRDCGTALVEVAASWRD